MGGFFDDLLFKYRQIKSGPAGLVLPARKYLQFGSGSVVDDPTNDTTIVWSTAAGARTIESFGPVGTSDDTATFIKAFAALGVSYNVLLLSAKNYNLLTAASRPFIVPTNCALIGEGFPVTTVTITGDKGCFQYGGDYSFMGGFTVIGDDPAPCVANHRNQFAIANGLTGGAASFSHVTAAFIRAVNCGGNAFQFFRPQSFDPRVGSLVIGCRAETGWTGFLTAESHEYVHYVQCLSYGNANANTYVASGNIKHIGCNLSICSQYNVWLDVGSNDSHGAFIGCTINHSSLRNIFAGAIANGMLFTGCTIIAAGTGGIELVGSTGVQFWSNQINLDTVAFKMNATSGTVFGPNTWYGSAPTETYTSDPDVFFDQGNRAIDGSVPAWIAAHQEPLIACTNGTTTLSKINSRARRLFLQTGGTSAAFTLKNAFPPYQGIPQIVVVNDNAQQCNFGFSTGGTVAVPTGTISTIGCSDGTNARKVA